MAKLLLLPLIFSFSLAANAQTRWKHLLGVTYAVDSKITFPDATQDTGLGSETEMDIEYQLKPAVRQGTLGAWALALSMS